MIKELKEFDSASLAKDGFCLYGADFFTNERLHKEHPNVFESPVWYVNKREMSDDDDGIELFLPLVSTARSISMIGIDVEIILYLDGLEIKTLFVEWMDDHLNVYKKPRLEHFLIASSLTEDIDSCYKDLVTRRRTFLCERYCEGEFKVDFTEDSLENFRNLYTGKDVDCSLNYSESQESVLLALCQDYDYRLYAITYQHDSGDLLSLLSISKDGQNKFFSYSIGFLSVSCVKHSTALEY